MSTARRLPTGSQLDTAMLCLGSAVLRVAHQADNPDAESGLTIHRFLQHARGSDEARTAALGQIEDVDTRERCAAIDLAQIPDGAMSEVALGWNPDTDEAEILALDGHRQYPDWPGWFFLTLDLVGLLPDGRGVFVADYKSGVALAAAESWQLRAGLLIAARTQGVDGGEVVMLPIGYDGKIRPDRAALDSFDLAVVREGLVDLKRRIAAASPDTVELNAGLHCRYCPALLACPAQTALVRAAVEHVATLEERIAELSTEEAGAAWGWLYQVGDRLDAIKAALRLRVLNGEEPIMPDGRRVRRVRSSTVKRSPKAAAELARHAEELRGRGEIWNVGIEVVKPVGKVRRRA